MMSSVMLTGDAGGLDYLEKKSLSPKKDKKSSSAFNWCCTCTDNIGDYEGDLQRKTIKRERF